MSKKLYQNLPEVEVGSKTHCLSCGVNGIIGYVESKTNKPSPHVFKIRIKWKPADSDCVNEKTVIEVTCPICGASTYCKPVNQRCTKNKERSLRKSQMTDR